MTDLVLLGGHVLTQDPRRPRATALAVRDGRLTAVGDDDEVLARATAGTRRVALRGRTVVPGLVDAHAHIWKIGHLLTSMTDLRGAASLADLQDRIAAAAARLAPGAWLQGRGYNEAHLIEGRSPTRWDLDRLVADRPVVLTRTCGHIVACNSRALEVAGIDRNTADPPGGVIARGPDGQPSGLLHETAVGQVQAHLPVPTRDDYAAMITAALRHQLGLGITSTTDAGVAPAVLDAYRWLDEEGRLPARVNVMALRRVDGVGTVPLPDRRVTPWLRIDTVKLLADGGLSGATAALSIPYRHTESRGVLRFTDAELLGLAREAHQAGFRLAIHAIGDVTIDQVLRVYEALGPGPVHHRIEHLGLPDPAHLARAARLGVIAVPQAAFLPALGRNFRQHLPDALLARAYPLRAMLDAGLTVALSSDAPVVEDDNPLTGIRAAVDRCDDAGDAIAPDQAITAEEALRAYTAAGAIASGDEDNRGSLAPGRWADFAVLSADPLATPVADLAGIAVEETWVGGHLAFQRT
jgi:predicted amidohydrolase YtcJ